MKKITFCLFLLGFCSCELFDTKKISSEEILKEEVKELDWNEVDQYPAFEECRRLVDKQKAKECFENIVTETFYSYLTAKAPVVTEEIDDTIFLYLTVSEEGRPLLDSLVADSLVFAQMPKIRMWFHRSLDSLPKIYPATKRGLIVQSSYKIPIVIQAE